MLNIEKDKKNYRGVNIITKNELFVKNKEIHEKLQLKYKNDIDSTVRQYKRNSVEIKNEKEKKQDTIESYPGPPGIR